MGPSLVFRSTARGEVIFVELQHFVPSTWTTLRDVKLTGGLVFVAAIATLRATCGAKGRSYEYRRCQSRLKT